MKLLRRVEHRGEWWAERPDGSWVRWDFEANDWEGPLPPPWPEEEPAARSPDASTVPEDSPGWAAPAPQPDRLVPGRGGDPAPESLGGDDPTNPVDEWWNRAFPPHSIKRLLFLLGALPFVAALHALFRRWRGEEVSPAMYVFISILGAVLLTFWWFSGALRVGGRRPESVTPPGPRAPAPDEPPLAAPSPRAWRKEFLVAVPLAFVGIMVLMAVADGSGAFRPESLLVGIASSMVVAVIVVLRTSTWGLVLFSLFAGLGGGVVLHLFTSLWGSGGGFLESWAIASLLVLACAAPFWWRLRTGRIRSRGGLPGGRPGGPGRLAPPVWVLMTSALIIMAGAAIFAAVTEGGI